MKKNEKNKSNNYNINSPIINYYSYMINPINSSCPYTYNLNQTVNNQIQHAIQRKKTFDKQSNKKINIFQDGPIQDEVKNNNLKKESDINNINNLENPKQNTNNYKKKIKSITPEDLIPTSINDRIILRINPLVYKNESYEFLSSNIYILLKDQLGCKYLQEKLETDTINAVCYFYPALIPNLLYLIKDNFANYFIQKICYYLNEDQIANILNILASDFLDICSDSHGTRAIQGIMNCLQTEKLRVLFFKIIKPIFISLIIEMNGIHIIYKFINEFSEFLEEINDIILDNCLNLATNKRGCFFTENYLIILGNFNDNNYKTKIIDKLLNNCSILITDKIGNYLIQYLLTLGDNKIISEIINKIINNIGFYSKHKYSNYVIEKLFIYSNPDDKNKIISKLSSPEIMNDLIFEPNSNYIILKALMYADIDKRNNMINIINNLESKIKHFPHGNNFLNKVNLYLNQSNYNNYNIKNENIK